MRASYRAMMVTAPGRLEMVVRHVPAPKGGEVLIAVEACGICGADVGDIEKVNPAGHEPRVPGHEIVGRIVALGDATPSIWRLGQRVGVGRLGGHCNECPQCRQGRFQLCRRQDFVGSTCDGGYAEMMLARATGLVSIPDELSSEEAAPILCAGIATFNALKKCGAEAGDLVAVFGIGGLGHMALQYARRMGFRVAAIGRGGEIAADARALGAHIYIDTGIEDAARRLQREGGARAIIVTAASAAVASSLLTALAPQGTLVMLGTGRESLTVAAGPVVTAEHRIVGSITGSPYENERALDFSVLADVRPWIERLPLERATEAYQRMKSGKARFRMVLTIPSGGG